MLFSRKEDFVDSDDVSPSQNNTALSSTSSHTSESNERDSSNLISDFEDITITDLSGNEHKHSGDEDDEGSGHASEKEQNHNVDEMQLQENGLLLLERSAFSQGLEDQDRFLKKERCDDKTLDMEKEESNNKVLSDEYENSRVDSDVTAGDNKAGNNDDEDDDDDDYESLGSNDVYGTSDSLQSNDPSEEDELSQEGNESDNEVSQEDEEEDDSLNVFKDKSFAKSGRTAVEVPEKCYDRIHTIVDNMRKTMNKKNRQQFEKLQVANMKASCKDKNIKFPFALKWLDMVAKFMLKNSCHKFAVQAWIDDNNKHLNSFFQHYAGFEDLNKKQIAKLNRVFKMLLCNIVKYDFQGLSLAHEENGMKKMTFADTFEKLNECMYEERASEKVPRELNMMCELSQITMSTNYGNNIHDLFTGVGTEIDKMVQKRHLKKRDLQELLVLTCCLTKAHRYCNLHLWAPMLNEYYNNKNRLNISEGGAMAGTLDATSYREMLSKYTKSNDHRCMKMKKQKEEIPLLRKKGGKVVFSHSAIK